MRNRTGDISVDPIRLPFRTARRLSQSRRTSPDGPQPLRLDASGGGMTGPTARRTASPVRLTLCEQLGRRVDGAWWPHSNRLARELPELVGVLHARLGEVVDISVNWSLSENLPDLNSRHWQNKHQHLMALTGRDASANLLIIPSLTPGTLAALLLRIAAGLPLSAAHQNTPLFRTAAEIVDAARGEGTALLVPAPALKQAGRARGRRPS
ncbi:MAG: DUF5994 family protein [Actinomycetota bacterium]|nr:DUF5994 family protein [Actinomycetota bacterium]